MLSRRYLSLRYADRLCKLTCKNKKFLVGRIWHDNAIQAQCLRRASGSSVTNPDSGQGSTAIEDASRPYKNRPFLQELFVGKFDTGVLVFPEFQRTEELQQLESKVARIETFFKEEVNSKVIDQSGAVPNEIIDRLRQLGLFGQQIPVEYGGLGLNNKEYARFSEVTALDGSIATLLSVHNDLAVRSILLAGTEEQKEIYLPDLASGTKIAAFCLNESVGGSDLASVQLRADRSADASTFTLNGTKEWITNAELADIFIVFAKTKYDVLGEAYDGVGVFIVDKSNGGMTITEREGMMGLKGSKVYDITFENTAVPAKNILGDLESGAQIAMGVLSNSRYFEGAAFAGIIKKCVTAATEHAIQTRRFNQPLTDFNLIKEKFGKIALQTYAMESMAYLTAGTSDMYQHPDVGLESAAVKIFSQETVRDCLHLCMEVFGASGYSAGNDLERHLRDAYTSSLVKGSGDILRLYIALLGVKYCGQELAETVRKINNPFNNVSFAMKRTLKRLSYSSKPKLTHQLYDHVHPVLSYASEDLETRVHQFAEIIEFCLSVYKKDVLEEQQTLKRLADIVIDLYAVTAVLARAGRSKAIGLRSADHEVLLAQVFTGEACKRIDATFVILKEGKYFNGDDQKKEFAESIFQYRGWAADSPLERNW